MQGPNRIRLIVCGAVAGAALIAVSSAQAAFPGQKGLIAFAHATGSSGTDSHIFTMDATGQHRTELTTSSGADFQPSFSADGERIVFERYISNTAPGQIWAMNADGSGQMQLTSGAVGADDSGASFSPDGTRIAFVRYDGSDDQIWAMNADGSGQTQLTFAGSTMDNAHAPVFSPDGGRIAFSHYSGASHNFVIATMNPDGSGFAAVTSPAVINDAFSPDYSPDGTRIAFVRYATATNDYNIAVVHSDGSGVENLTANVDDHRSPVFSPEGNRVAYAFVGGKATNSDIELIDSTGLEQNPLDISNSPEGIFDSGPSWQPLNPPSCTVTDGRSKSPKRATVTVECPAEDATAVISGSGKAPSYSGHKAKKFKLPAVTMPIAPDTATQVTLEVSKGSKSLKKALKAGEKAKAAITTTLTDSLGLESTVNSDVKFKAPPH